MTTEQELELMRGMLNDLMITVDKLAATTARRDEDHAKRDAEYHKLRQRLLRGALGWLGTDESKPGRMEE